MKVMVTGSRVLADKDVTPNWAEIKADLWRVLDELNPDILIHGGASGPDTWSHQWADEHDTLVDVQVVRPRRGYNQSYAQAAFERNLLMLDRQPDVVVSVHDGKSSGTAHTLDAATERGIRIIHVIPQGS